MLATATSDLEHPCGDCARPFPVDMLHGHYIGAEYVRLCGACLGPQMDLEDERQEYDD
jgi:hypothetical protein